MSIEEANNSAVVEWGKLTPSQVAEAKKHLFTTDIMPSRPMRQATIEARRELWHNNLKHFDPQSQELLNYAFGLGQEVVIEQALPVFVDWSVLLSKSGAAMERITATLLSDNGPRTRLQLREALGDLIKYIDELDTTTREINGNPRSALWVDVDGLQLEMVQDLRTRVKEFFANGAKDQHLDELREYLADTELIDASQLFSLGARGKRGKPRDEVLDRIAAVVYEMDQRRQPGQTHRDIARFAIAKLRAHEDEEAVIRYEKEKVGKKRNTFTGQMIKRHEEKLGVRK